MGDVVLLEYKTPNGQRIAKGRYAWTLERLLKAGQKGCTPIEYPAPRWSAYVHILRQEGLIIETVTESHKGAYAGSHARYVLKTPIEIVREERK